MPHLKVNRKLEPFLTIPKPIKVAIGGRGSGKSIGFGDIFTMKMDTEGADVYCLREFQDSVGDSVHKVFVESIQERLQLPGWKILENKVVAPNGAATTYKGANRNPDSMQSAHGYKYSWFEEAHRASKASLDKLLPTILRNPGAECWFSANPQSSGDPFSQRFIVPYQVQLDRDGYYEDDIHLIVVVNWRDNPWWNAEQEALRAWDYENRPRAEYDWIWEGKFNDTVENSIILPEWFDAAIDAHIKLGFKPRGAKVAAHDPSDEGEDSKGYALRHGTVILDIQENTELDVNDGLDWATDLAIAGKADHFVWDGDGLGLSLKRQVAQTFTGKPIKYHIFHGGGGVDNPDQIYMGEEFHGQGQQRKNKDAFRNRRAQYYWLLRDRFYNTYRAVKHGEYKDPDELISLSSDIKVLQKLRSEMCRIPRKPTGAGMIQIMSKEEMKNKHNIQSPNLADTVMMMFLDGMSIADGWGEPIKYPTRYIV